jgi:SpoVK/Ycf46/Vps4 family AAA+-type ATPase
MNHSTKCGSECIGAEEARAAAEKTDIELSIIAHDPLIYVVTPEEERFLKEMERICMHRRRKLWVHSISTGVYNISFACVEGVWKEPHRGCLQQQLSDPVALLQNLRGRNANEGVFVLLDFHAVLRDSFVKRLLKDVAQRFRETRNTVMIVSPTADLPADMENEFAFFNFPLPSRDLLAAKLESVLDSQRLRGTPIRLAPGDAERIAETGLGLTLKDFESALNRTLARGSGQTGEQVVAGVFQTKKQTLRRSGVIACHDTKETIHEVGGMSVLKAWLSKRQRAFTAEAADFGLPKPKGILLLGVPGCGKTLAAKACAAVWKLPLLQLDAGRVFSSAVGSSEENCRKALQLAEVAAPCILWIDEIEKALAGVGSSSLTDGGTAARVFATIAVWLQEKTAPVFVIATANTVTSLPPELIRRGRWDEVFFLDLPGFQERREIFRIHLRKCARDPEKFELDRLAEACPGFSGAEIEQAVISGLYDAFDDDRTLSSNDILSQIQTIIPLSKTMGESVQALRSWALTRARLASDERPGAEKRPRRGGSIRPV